MSLSYFARPCVRCVQPGMVVWYFPSADMGPHCSLSSVRFKAKASCTAAACVWVSGVIAV